MSGEPVKSLAVEAATPRSSDPSPTNKLAVATPTMIFGDPVNPSATVAIPATPAYVEIPVNGANAASPACVA